jgi:hypothetical protein
MSILLEVASQASADEYLSLLDNRAVPPILEAICSPCNKNRGQHKSRLKRPRRFEILQPDLSIWEANVNEESDGEVFAMQRVRQAGFLLR